MKKIISLISAVLFVVMLGSCDKVEEPTPNPEDLIIEKKVITRGGEVKEEEPKEEVLLEATEENGIKLGNDYVIEVKDLTFFGKADFEKSLESKSKTSCSYKDDIRSFKAFEIDNTFKIVDMENKCKTNISCEIYFLSLSNNCYVKKVIKNEDTYTLTLCYGLITYHWETQEKEYIKKCVIEKEEWFDKTFEVKDLDYNLED